MFIIFADIFDMARLKKDRFVQMAPSYTGFKPQGVQRKSITDVYINYEEYEALNLCDYELLTQAEAAEMMNISRPTFTRIYESVRRKIAKAFIEGSCIYFEGGNATLAQWFKCERCEITFSLFLNSDKSCPFCKSKHITENC
jgi:predicted DNA-binding protein (UPF0251 family)